jgi:bifunctional non-homologous end joining protein LigD
MIGIVTDRLQTYRGMRDPRRTPEPVPPPAPLPAGNNDTFVIQEHHARRLHWDFRLERDGVLVSWAVPRGLPLDPGTNHLAVHTEDHPLDYAAFAGEIPKGEYGGGRVLIWDRGTYETEEWTDSKVKVVLHGSRVSGRYVLFHTRDRDWMVHRMDPPPDPGWEPLPELIRPMFAVAGSLPKDDEGWGYELKWDGVRAVAYVEGGRLRLMSRNDRDVTASYPELRAFADRLGSRQVVLDGEVVAVDPKTGRPSFARLQRRMHVTGATQVRRLTGEVPVSYFAFDLLHTDGHSALSRPYAERRDLLEGLQLGEETLSVPPSFRGDGSAVLHASAQQGLEGVVAKRLDSPYLPGRRSDAWIKVKNVRTQEVVVAGWKPGDGRRAGTMGSLLLGLQGEQGLEYVGHVGTGFTDRMLRELAAQLAPLARPTSPFATQVPRPDAKDARWVEPRLVGEVAFGEWTPDGRLRHPSWRGLRSDKGPEEVQREP